MTRLADALQRANRTPERGPAVAVAPPPAQRSEPQLRPVAARHAEVPPLAPGLLTPLLAAPTRESELRAWRTDPQLVGKLLGTDGFSPAALEQYRKLAATLHHADAMAA